MPDKRPQNEPPRAPRKPAGVREDRSKRLLDLVVLLLGARAPVPFREVRNQFKAYRTENEEAGLRAFERDKADLVELGVPLRYVTPDEDDTVDEAGYVIDLRRYRMPDIRFTADEVAALFLAGSLAHAAPGTTYAKVVDLALKKLAFDLPDATDTPGGSLMDQLEREPVLVHYPKGDRSSDLPDRMASLESAIRNRKRVTMRYRSASAGEVMSRDVDPYGMASRQGAWILVGYCHLREGIRSFRLDRIEEVTVAPKPKTPDFERPENFQVRYYAGRSPWTFEAAPPVRAQLRYSPAAGSIAQEEFGENLVEQLDLADGWKRITFRCANPDYVVSRVLMSKGAIVVESPDSLKARVQDELAAVRARYA